MGAMRSRTIVASLALLTVCLSGCSWFHRWGAPTTYEFIGLRPTDAVYVEQVFRDRGVTFDRVGREPPTYEVTGIHKMKDLAGLHRAIDKAIERHGLEVEFREARLTYSGLSGASDVATTISVTISPPDAIVHIADGEGRNPWRLIQTDRRGGWTGTVNTAGVVTRTGGWVYIHSQRGSLERVFRVNVLSKRQERWLGEMPFDTPPKSE